MQKSNKSKIALTLRIKMPNRWICPIAALTSPSQITASHNTPALS